MRRQLLKNPFYIVLGFIGFTFTITSASYCLSVLRGVRPQSTLTDQSHPLEEIMDRHGTSLLTGQLIILAIATVGAVAVDHINGQSDSKTRHLPNLMNDNISESDKPLETKRS